MSQPSDFVKTAQNYLKPVIRRVKSCYRVDILIVYQQYQPLDLKTRGLIESILSPLVLCVKCKFVLSCAVFIIIFSLPLIYLYYDLHIPERIGVRMV